LEAQAVGGCQEGRRGRPSGEGDRIDAREAARTGRGGREHRLPVSIQKTYDAKLGKELKRYESSKEKAPRDY
jgi:hypothetical protein